MLWMLSVIVIVPPVRAAWQHLEDNDAQCSGGQEQRQMYEDYTETIHNKGTLVCGNMRTL